jgi:hypothetical protein
VVARSVLAGFQKLSVQLQELCYSVEVKDLNSLVLRSFQQIQKVSVLKSKEITIQTEVKGKDSKYMNICQTLSYPRPIQPLLNRILARVPVSQRLSNLTEAEF